MPIGDDVDPLKFEDKDLAVVRVVAQEEKKFFDLLLRTMRRRHDYVSYGVGGRLETIGMAFGHVILTGRPSLRTEENSLRDMLIREFGLYVDPATGLRVSYVESSSRWDECAAFFGRGVFAPGEEEPVGVVRVQPCDAAGRLIDEPTAVTLPLTLRSGGVGAAGFYRGQGGLVFGHHDSRIAPAEHTGARDPAAHEADRVFFYLAPRRARGPQRTQQAQASELVCFDDPAAQTPAAYHHSIETVETDDPEDEGLTAIDVKKDVRLFRTTYSFDSRPSRLRATPGAGYHLKIVGLVAPQDVFGASWWINLDARGRLVASSATASARTIVCEGARTASYSWVSNPPDFDGRSDWSLTAEKSREERLSILRPNPANPPLGFLRPPEETRAAVFERDPDGTGYELDWLDWAGAVRMPGGAAVPLGLSWARAQAEKKRKDPNAPDPTAPGARAASREDGRGVLIRQKTERSLFASSWDGTWREGLEFRIGPLILSAVRGE